MKVARTAEELATARALLDGPVGFVPTMGALHDGHLALIRAARAAARTVVLSIFVNPLQFGPSEDFAAYPRDERRDLLLVEGEGVDLVWLPSVEEMYPEGESTVVTVGRLGHIVEGEHRPGHFDGVATVVAKLFNQVRPDVAFFGQKDAQQVAVIKRMVRDLRIPVEIRVAPTVRDSDGLAMSSRNAYLSPEERGRALVLFRALEAGRRALSSGEDAALAAKVMWEELSRAPGVTPDYAVAVDPATFESPAPGTPILLAVAARVGKARLIDNVLVDV